MAYKVRMTAPKSQIEGWNGRVSVDGGATWVRLTKYVGEPQFMLCPNCEDTTAMIPIVLQGKDGPFISGLVCVGPKCPEDGTFVEVVNGYPKTA